MNPASLGGTVGKRRTTPTTRAFTGSSVDRQRQAAVAAGRRGGPGIGENRHRAQVTRLYRSQDAREAAGVER